MFPQYPKLEPAFNRYIIVIDINIESTPKYPRDFSVGHICKN